MSNSNKNLPKGTYKCIIATNLYNTLTLNELEDLAHNMAVVVDRNLNDNKTYKYKLCCALGKRLLNN